MFQWSPEFIFITLSILAVTVITTGHNALGTSASDIFDRNLTGNDGHRQSSPLRGMNFSETSEVYTIKEFWKRQLSLMSMKVWLETNQ